MHGMTPLEKRIAVLEFMGYEVRKTGRLRSSSKTGFYGPGDKFLGTVAGADDDLVT